MSFTRAEESSLALAVACFLCNVTEESTITELILGSILKHLWLEDSLVKITFSNSHAGHVEMGFPHYGNKLIMVVLFSESGIFAQELVGSHRIQMQ